MRAPSSAIVLAARLITLTSIMVLTACGSPPQPPAPERPAIVARPVAASEQSVSFFSGDIRARHESQLGFRVAGKIERRLVDVGARVDAGDVLATLDPADFRLQLAAAEAAARSAAADAELARAERDRHATLLERQLISESLFQAQDTALAAAEARLAQVRAQLDVARNQVQYARLVADRAGVVTQIQAETGQVVAAGQVIAVLAQDGDREVEIALPETGVDRFTPGMPARISLWSEPGRVLAGTLREVAPGADSASRTWRARVTIVDPDASVNLGQTARVRFTSESDDASSRWSIPITALHVHEGAAAVWRLDPATRAVTLIPVEVSAYHEDTVELASGVDGDAWLVVAGVHKLSEGQIVRPIDRDNRPVALNATPDARR